MLLALLIQKLYQNGFESGEKFSSQNYFVCLAGIGSAESKSISEKGVSLMFILKFIHFSKSFGFMDFLMTERQRLKLFHPAS